MKKGSGALPVVGVVRPTCKRRAKQGSLLYTSFGGLPPPPPSLGKVLDVQGYRLISNPGMERSHKEGLRGTLETGGLYEALCTYLCPQATG